MNIDSWQSSTAETTVSELPPRLRLLTERQASEALAVSQACLRRMRRESRGPVFCRVGRRVRYSLGALEDFLRKNSSPQK